MILQKSGPLCLMSSMRFESKHKELKDIANSISSRLNVQYTLALKHQLKLSYRLLSSINICSSLEVGRILKLNASQINNYNTNMHFSTSKLNFNAGNII